MPIKMLRMDVRFVPAVFCDYCGTRINSAAEGNYEWSEVLGDDDSTELYFAHKACSIGLRQAHGGNDIGHLSVALEVFPLDLGNNLQVDWDEARETARQFAKK